MNEGTPYIGASFELPPGHPHGGTGGHRQHQRGPVRRWYRIFLAAGVVFLLVLTFAMARALAGLGDDRDHATVVRVVDGDTLTVRLDGDVTTIRLLNIDTPETKDPNRPVQCLGPEASTFLEHRLPPGTKVELEYDQERADRYGRTLAGVFENNSLINAEIASEGLGLPVLFKPNDRFLREVESASREAQSAGRGLFSPDIECTPASTVSALEALVQSLPSSVGGDPAVALEEATTAVNLGNMLATSLTMGSVNIPRNDVFTAARVSTHLTGLRTRVEEGVRLGTSRQTGLASAKSTYDTEQERIRQENLAREEERLEEERREQERLEQERRNNADESSTQEASGRHGEDGGGRSNDDAQSERPSSETSTDDHPSRERTSTDGEAAPSRRAEPNPQDHDEPPSRTTEEPTSKGSSSSGCVPYGPEIPYSEAGGYTGKRYGMPGGKTFRKCS